MTGPIEPLATTDAVVTAPVAATAAPAGKRSRARWLAALAAVLLLAGLAGGATLLLTASAGDAAVLAWVPADAVAYAELRLDLPGSQRTELPKLLAALPGFKDQAAFPAKLGEALDRLVGAATDGKHAYQSEIAPWFGGELAVASGPMTTPSAGATPTEIAAAARVLLLVNVTDTAKADAWLGGLVATADVELNSEAYGGTTITRVHPKTAGMPDGAYALLGSVLVAGDPASVKAAVDTRGSRGLGTLPAYRSAASAVSGDHVAFVWADAKTLAATASASAGAGAIAKDALLGALLGVARDATPAWVAAAVRALDGNLVIDAVRPKGGDGAQTAAATDVSQLAKLAPADTLVLLGAKSPGAAIAGLKTRLAADPALAPVVTQVDQTLGILGGTEAITGWIGDSAIVVTDADGSPSAGLVMVPLDLASATRLLKQLRAVAQIGGATVNVIPTFTDTQHGDAVVTSVDIPNAGGLLKLLQGAMGSTGGTGGTPALPGGLTPPANLHISFAYAATPQVVVFGSDARFVNAVLDARGGPSLATQPRFKDLLGKAGASGDGLAWVDIAAVRDHVAAALPASDRATYDADAKPYLAPLDALVAAGTTDGDLARCTIILSIKP